MEPTYCPRDPTITRTFVIAEHVAAGISFPINFLGIYCILKASSRVQARIKKLLLTMQIWQLFCDLTVSFFLIPDFALPIPVVSPYGILKKMDITTETQLIISVTIFGGFASAGMHLFFMRHQTILPAHHPRMFSWISQKIIILGFYIIFGGFGIPVYFFLPSDSLETKWKLTNQFPCVPLNFFDSQSVAFEMDRFIYLLAYGIIYMTTWTVFVSLLVFETFYTLRTSSSLSQSTKAMLARSLVIIITQLGVSFLVLVIPIFILIVAAQMQNVSQALVAVCVVGVSIHASFGTSVMLFLNNQYRKFIMSSILRIKTTSSVGALTVSRAY